MHVVAWTCNATCVFRVLIRIYVYDHLKHDTSQKYSVTVELFCSSAAPLYCRCMSLTGLAELWEDTGMTDSHWLYRDWHCRRTREHTVHSLPLPCCADSSDTTLTRVLHMPPDIGVWHLQILGGGSEAVFAGKKSMSLFGIYCFS